jgi:hypothetical protein
MMGKLTFLFFFLFFSSYKDDRFFWEIVLSLRKIIIVGLGVFGPSLGPVSQSLVALLVLFIFIVLEILGDPFKEPTARHKILAKLELSTLMVLFLTMWSGLMIFSSTEANDTVSVEVLTVLVVLMTVVMMVWLIAQLARECGHEKAASVVEMKQKFVALRRRVSLFRMSPEARQRDIRRRTFDANESTTSVNPVAIEMADIYPSDSVATGEIKVDDDVIDVRSGASFMQAPPSSPAALPRRNRMESLNAKKKGLTYKNPTARNNQSAL